MSDKTASPKSIRRSSRISSSQPVFQSNTVQSQSSRKLTADRNLPLKPSVRKPPLKVSQALCGATRSSKNGSTEEFQSQQHQLNMSN